MTGEKVEVARDSKDRELQRALMQYYKPENREIARRAYQMAEGKEEGGRQRPGRRRSKKKPGS